MEKLRFFASLSLAFATIFVASFAHAEAPGCLQAIQGKAITEAAAKLLPKPCQEFRKAYLKGLDELAHAPQKFESRLKSQIGSAKGNASPYNSLLLAVLSQSPKQNEVLLPVIEKRAATEQKLKLTYPYARVALEKMKTGKCDSYPSPVYDELCKNHDLVYERLVALNQNEKASAEAKKK